MSKPSIALVYDWVTTPYGGAEHVLVALHEAFPEAPLFTSIYNQQTATWAKNFKVKPSFLQHFPLAKRYFRAYGPLMPLAFESFDLSDYDVIISVTSAFAKSVLTQPHQRHICYLLTPNRHLYSHRTEYQQQVAPRFSWLIKPVLKYLHHHDQSAAHRPDVIIPISQLIAQRTKEYYQRDSQKVIYPPLPLTQTEKTSVNSLPELPSKYYLIVSRLVPYKQLDLAIRACQEMGRNLVIVGSGPELRKLKQLATTGPSRSQIIFLDNVSPSELELLYNRATGLLMPGLEDFGITALEAVAHGVPVILHTQSGAAEIIHHLQEGVHLPNSSLAELIKAMHTLEMTAWDPVIMKKQVQKYSTEHFQKEFKNSLDL